MDNNSKLNILPMDFINDKNEIANWEFLYGNTPEFDSIREFILEGQTFHGLKEVIYVNSEIYPIGNDERQFSLVAKNENNEVVAWILCDVFNLTTDKPEMYLQYIVIHPMHQHKGYGTQIAKEIFLSPKKYFGVKPTYIFARIDINNISSLALFDKFNFSFTQLDDGFVDAHTEQPKLINQNIQKSLGE